MTPRTNNVTTDTFRQGWQYLNRIYLAQIVVVNKTKGTINVEVRDGLIMERKELEIPWTAFSFDGATDGDGNLVNAWKSSWMRYMPHVGDLVYIGFGPHSEARVLGMATGAGQYDVWRKERQKNPSKVPVGDWRVLNSGEWDMRSSGGAYIFGATSGELLLSAGPMVRARLDKANDEGRLEAQLWQMGGAGSHIKIGDVKRTIHPTSTTPFKESTVAITPPLAMKEWTIHLENPLPEPTLICDEQFGAVYSNLGTPEMGSINPASFVRHRRKIYSSGTFSTSPVPISVFASEIDSSGNAKIEFGDALQIDPPPTKVEVSSATASLEASFANVDITAALKAVLEATAPLLSSGGVHLGSADGAEQLILGTTYIAQMNAAWTAVGLAMTNLAAALPIVVAAITPPITDPTKVATISAATIAIGALGTLATTMASTDMIPPTSKFLSQKVATE